MCENKAVKVRGTSHRETEEAATETVQRQVAASKKKQKKESLNLLNKKKKAPSFGFANSSEVWRNVAVGQTASGDAGPRTDTDETEE